MFFFSGQFFPESGKWFCCNYAISRAYNMKRGLGRRGKPQSRCIESVLVVTHNRCGSSSTKVCDMRECKYCSNQFGVTFKVCTTEKHHGRTLAALDPFQSSQGRESTCKPIVARTLWSSLIQKKKIKLTPQIIWRVGALPLLPWRPKGGYFSIYSAVDPKVDPPQESQGSHEDRSA